MNLSDRELNNLQSMYTYYLFKEKASRYFLTGLFVMIGMWLITVIIQRGENFLVIGIGYLALYLFLSGSLWLLFTLVTRRVEKKRIEMDLSREQFEQLIGYDRVTGKMNKHFIKRPWDDL